MTYTYDAAGTPQRVDKGNGTFTTYDYDAAGQILHLINYRAGRRHQLPLRLHLRRRGRRTSMATLDGSWTLHLRRHRPLTRAVFASANTATIPNQDLQYFYDALGNRTKTILNGVTTNYTTNNLNQYTSVGGATYTYDADGNLTSTARTRTPMTSRTG